MEIGILTVPFGDKPLEAVAAFAGNSGFAALEVGVASGRSHIDVANFSPADADAVLALMQQHNLHITSLAAYVNVTDANPQAREQNIQNVSQAIEAAKLLGVDVVCANAGMPVPGKSKFETIEQDCVEVFPPLLDQAGQAGIKIALENWFETNLQGLEHWQWLFDVLPQENFGLNFDPSHLIWQGIDYIAAVHHFGERIFHTHAKDTEIREERLRWLGNQERGWWRYVIPGFGAISWGEYIGALRAVGYDGVLSIEHEDSAFGREEGFIAGRKYLEMLV